MPETLNAVLWSGSDQEYRAERKPINMAVRLAGAGRPLETSQLVPRYGALQTHLLSVTLQTPRPEQSRTGTHRVQFRP
jgi:hypothetical protein